MQLIEKIEIKSFRSFGNQKKNKTQITNIKDLNIFSGANDSGKSNILRALNLFFNQRTNLNDFINFNKDFFKPSKEYENEFIKEEMITIKIYFWNKKNKGINKESHKSSKLPEKFWVSRKWLKTSTYTDFNQADGIDLSLKNEKGDAWSNFTHDNDNNKLKSNIRAGLTNQLGIFLNSIQYHYVPAIKDEHYFSHLYGELQRTLLKEHKSDVNRTKNEFENAIQSTTQNLMDEFEKVVENKNLNISAAFELPDLINLFKTLNVQTGEDIDLKYRGDGIQAKFIPEILYFIALKELQLKQSKIVKGEKVKKYFIWGFEEPENSYEYKNLKLLADRFLKVFSKYSQIFITTHSREFLSLKEIQTVKELSIINDKNLLKANKELKLEKLKLDDTSSEISLYRVWKSTETYYTSQIIRFNNDKNQWDKVCDDLGIIEDSRTIEALQERLTAEKEKVSASSLTDEKKERIIAELNQEKKELLLRFKTAEEKIAEYQKICVFFEDEYLQIYKIAFLKLNDIDCDEENFENLFDNNLSYIFFSKNGKKELQKFLDQAKIDEHKDKKIIGIFDFDDAYGDFNGLNASRWDVIQGDDNTGLYRKRKETENFYSLILPVPNHRNSYASKMTGKNSALSIELLFEDAILKQLNSWKEIQIPRTTLYESRFNGQKNNFWKKIFDLNKNDFIHFKLIFDKIDELFN